MRKQLIYADVVVFGDASAQSVFYDFRYNSGEFIQREVSQADNPDLVSKLIQSVTDTKDKSEADRLTYYAQFVIANKLDPE